MDLITPFADPLDNAFLFSAVLGGLLFTVTAVLAMVGGGDVDGLAGLAAGGDVQLVSFHTLTAFFLVFGLTGLALHRGSGLGDTTAMLGAFAVAFAVMLVVAKLVQMLRRLETSGNLHIADHAVGASGDVYLTIPEHGAGQVQIVIAGRLMTLDAVADEGAPIPTGERVRVVAVDDGERLVVRRV
jgi:membrane protein implicated in regulation of membrane protease activity